MTVRGMNGPREPLGNASESKDLCPPVGSHSSVFYAEIVGRRMRPESKWLCSLLQSGLKENEGIPERERDALQALAGEELERLQGP